MNQFLRFFIVGTIGFVVDAGALQIAVFVLHANVYAARVVSFLAAASVTWLLNRRYTFAVNARPTYTEWLRYLAFMVLGASVNYGAFAFSIAHSDLVAAQPWLGVAIGSVAGMGLNFTTSRLLFRRS